MEYGNQETFHLQILEKRLGGKHMILCDTNIIIEVLKKNQAVIHTIEKIGLDKIAISAVTAMELYYGALNKIELKKIKRHLSAIRIFHIEEDISITATGLIEKYAKSHGLQIPDALIAGTALNYDIKLYTHNKKDFI